MKSNYFLLINNISVVPTEVMKSFMFMLGNFTNALKMGNGTIFVKVQNIMTVNVDRNEDVVRKFFIVLAILMNKKQKTLMLKE